jgi:hypothetical protein
LLSFHAGPHELVDVFNHLDWSTYNTHALPKIT